MAGRNTFEYRVHSVNIYEYHTLGPEKTLYRCVFGVCMLKFLKEIFNFFFYVMRQHVHDTYFVCQGEPVAYAATLMTTEMTIS